MATFTLEELRAELAADPSELGYAPLVHVAADSELAVLLNTPRVPVLSYAAIADLQAALHSMLHSSNRSVWTLISRSATTHASETVQDVCQLIVDITQARYQSVNMGLPLVDLSLGALVTAEILTEQQKTDLLELGRVNISRAEELWGRGTRISIEQIGAAR
jgi:hypothetical protein